VSFGGASLTSHSEMTRQEGDADWGFYLILLPTSLKQAETYVGLVLTYYAAVRRETFEIGAAATPILVVLCVLVFVLGDRT